MIPAYCPDGRTDLPRSEHWRGVHGAAGLFGRHAVAMWVLDPANSPALIEQLRPHGRDGEFEVAWVGEGWRSLVEECHTRLVATFPEYQLLAIKLKYGVLEYQAFPRRSARDAKRWSDSEAAAVGAITDECRTKSDSVCEWCGGHAELREWRSLELTLCDECDAVPRPSLQGSWALTAALPTVRTDATQRQQDPGSFPHDGLDQSG